MNTATPPPHRMLPPIEEILLLKADHWTHERIGTVYGVTKKAVDNALWRWRKQQGISPGRKKYTGLPFVVTESHSERGIWRYLIANERRNLGMANEQPVTDERLDRWRQDMGPDEKAPLGYVVGYDRNLAPDPEGTDPEEWTSYLGGGYFFVWPRHEQDPVSDDPSKPIFITLRDKDGRFRTWEEVAGITENTKEAKPAKPRVNLRGM